MRLLLLGHNGQLGSDIKRACEARGDIDVTPIGRDTLDVSNLAAIVPALSEETFDVAVNCTSYHKTDEVEHNATLAFTINAHAVQEMARACRIKNAKLIHISTDYVFDGKNDSPYTESDCVGPINVYGASKAMGEALATHVYEQVYVLRVASLFGVAGASGKGSNFVETILCRARDEGEVRVVNDIVMSPTSTADVADMILRMIDRNAPPAVYHAVNSGYASWHDFACSIVSSIGSDAKVIAIGSGQYPTVARRPTYSVLSNERIRAIIGPIPDWRDALQRYLMQKGHLCGRTFT